MVSYKIWNQNQGFQKQRLRVLFTWPCHWMGELWTSSHKRRESGPPESVAPVTGTGRRVPRAYSVPVLCLWRRSCGRHGGLFPGFPGRVTVNIPFYRDKIDSVLFPSLYGLSYVADTGTLWLSRPTARWASCTSYVAIYDWVKESVCPLFKVVKSLRYW